MQFEVGDRVMLPENLPWFRGREGTVVKVSSLVWVLWDFNSQPSGFLFPEKLVLIGRRKTYAD